jgi:hypothetical protein
LAVSSQSCCRAIYHTTVRNAAGTYRRALGLVLPGVGQIRKLTTNEKLAEAVPTQLAGESGLMSLISAAASYRCQLGLASKRGSFCTYSLYAIGLKINGMRTLHARNVRKMDWIISSGCSEMTTGKKLLDGAGRGNRTPMTSRSRDFESRASTNSAIPATLFRASLQEGDYH